MFNDMIPVNIKELVVSLSNSDCNKYFGMFVGNFLDYVYNCCGECEENIEKTIIDEPDMYDNVEAWCYSYLAAMAHSIEYKYELDIKEEKRWFNSFKYVLRQPYFPGNLKGNIRLVLIKESPVEFRIRNLFVSSNVLSRV